MAAIPAEGGGQQQPLTYKTWVLKVSIHCEGCKRKVKRILHGVEGVYTIDVDTRQHKLIVTGNVDVNTLIKKLEKSGKHAELWPEFLKIPNNSQRNEELINQEQQQPNQNPSANVEEPQKNNGESQQGTDNSGQQQQQQQQGEVVREVRFEGNIPAAGDAQKSSGNNAGGGGSGGGGGGKKKKKKKGNNSNNNPNNNNNSNSSSNNSSNNNGEVATTEQGANGEPHNTESHPPQQHSIPNTNPGQVSVSPPRYPPYSRVYEYPPAYYAPTPVYAVSYNTVYPSSNYSASYYSAPPPNSYAYVHQGGDVEPPVPFDWNSHAAPPSDSFEMFSDENPNACSIM